ncbi:CcmD family protein [Desulfonatronovibrio magnus]|nr:CcmD family protein [Desulfonatronovibrio magnus]
MTYLILSNIVVWLGIGGYISYLAIVQKRLEQKVRQLELRVNE